MESWLTKSSKGSRSDRSHHEETPQLEHVQNSFKGYKARTGCSLRVEAARFALSRPRQTPPGKSGHSAAGAADCYLRSWMLLASAQELQICVLTEKQFGFLGEEIQVKRRQGSSDSTEAERIGMDRTNCMGMPNPKGKLFR